MEHPCSARQCDRASGRYFREYRGKRFWWWTNRSLYISQAGGRVELLHRRIYEDRHGPLGPRVEVVPGDGGWDDFDAGNWTARVKGAGRDVPRKHRVQHFGGVAYYWKPSGYFKAGHEQGGEYMHRVVWRHHHGAIPAGHHVHHEDGDRGNNEIGNLRLMRGADHQAHHARESEWVGSAGNVAQLADVRALASEWHRSNVGRAWHSEHGRRAWATREWVAVACVVCGAVFQTPYPTRAKYCSGACKQTAQRRRSREDRAD